MNNLSFIGFWGSKCSHRCSIITNESFTKIENRRHLFLLFSWILRKFYGVPYCRLAFIYRSKDKFVYFIYFLISNRWNNPHSTCVLDWNDWIWKGLPVSKNCMYYVAKSRNFQTIKRSKRATEWTNVGDLILQIWE